MKPATSTATLSSVLVLPTVMRSVPDLTPFTTTATLSVSNLTIQFTGTCCAYLAVDASGEEGGKSPQNWPPAPTCLRGWRDFARDFARLSSVTRLAVTFLYMPHRDDAHPVIHCLERHTAPSTLREYNVRPLHVTNPSATKSCGRPVKTLLNLLEWH